MQKALSALCIILVWGALTLTLGKVVDRKQFGQCVVGTDVDDFTNEKSPSLVCIGEGDNSGDHVVVLLCSKQLFGTLLRAGTQLYLGETIGILYRFDKGKLGKESWRYRDSVATSRDKDIHNHFVEGIQKAKKLFFKVGDEDSFVDLTGSAGAVTEYKKRCSALRR
jgi:hypothetical protein